MSSRRDFLKTLSVAALTTGFAEAFWGQSAISGLVVPGKPGMMVRSFRFLDLEMPIEALSTWITPVEHFFVRNHMFEPSTVDATSWNLAVGGEVEHSLELSLPELKKFPAAKVINTLECAGNGRAFFRPHVPGAQWQKGAVGTAEFSGVRLKDVLERAGAKASAKHVMFRGLDEVPGKVPPFVRSIPIEKAMNPDTLLATGMNGRSLPKHHGYPARVLVPGWIGAASVKWLTEIRVLEKEFEGNFMKPGYRMPNHPVSPGEAVSPDETSPITALHVKSIIARPNEGARIRLVPTQIMGAAWAGEAQVARVEVSTDNGNSWQAAQLGADHAPYAWRLWHFRWKPAAAGTHVLMSRATDDNGQTQPSTAIWNPGGYLWNAIDQVKVNVEA